MDNINLRAHHLLCSVLYKGKGYSEAFTTHMTSVVDAQKKEDAMIILLTEPDEICSECPNKRPNGGCAIDTERYHLKISGLDHFVLEYFHLPSNTPLSRSYIYKQVRENITEDFFNTCCHNCRWKKQGLCSYEEYMERLDMFI